MCDQVSSFEHWTDQQSEMLLTALASGSKDVSIDTRKQKLLKNFELYVPNDLNDFLTSANNTLETIMDRVAEFCVHKLELRIPTEPTTGTLSRLAVRLPVSS